MRNKITEKPIGNFQLSSSQGHRFSLKKHRIPDGNGKHEWLFFNQLWRKAFANPGETQRYYFEENGVEYEHHATWDHENKIMVANDVLCPFQWTHHTGDTCAVCRMDG